MFACALAATAQIFAPRFRAALWKVLALTILLLGLAWLGLDRLILSFATVPSPWLHVALSVLTGVGLFLGLAFFLAPASSLVAGFYLDELAEVVESEIDPQHPVGRPLPPGRAVWVATRFAGVSLLVNALALVLLLIPGVNLIAFFGANAYLLGREYFELAALRFRSLDEARALRRRHAPYLFACGLWIAAFLAVPGLNLLTPLFGIAFMARIYKRLDPAPPLARPAASD